MYHYASSSAIEKARLEKTDVRTFCGLHVAYHKYSPYATVDCTSCIAKKDTRKYSQEKRGNLNG